MEQENSEWISLGFVGVTIFGCPPKSVNDELCVKFVLGEKYYAIRHYGTLYRIAPDKEGWATFCIGGGDKLQLRLPNP